MKWRVVTLFFIAGIAALGWNEVRHDPVRPAMPRAMSALIAHADEFRPLPFHELAERVNERYRGRLIAAQVVQPSRPERDLGAALVYEFRLMTPQRNLLRIRMDARNGRFLEIAGRGQLDALRRNDDDED